MRSIVLGSWTAVLVALAAIPGSAHAKVGLAVTAKQQPEDDEELVIIDDDEIEGEDPVIEIDDETPTTTTDDVPDLFGDDGPEPTPSVPAEGSSEAEPDSEEAQTKAEMGLITVVQRQRMLKKGRFELQPQFGITVNDPYVRHYTLGLDLNYWITNRMAVGITGTGLIGARTPRYDNIRFQLGMLLTANQVLWQVSANYTYTPFYGKIAIFNRALLHWESSVVVGGGATQTRIFPRYEALHEPFTTVTGGGHVGIMGRFYGPRVDWLSINWGVRAWIYPDKVEPENRGPDTDVGGTDDPALFDAQAAKDAAKTTLGFNVTAFLGVSFFFPTSFDYSTSR